MTKFDVREETHPAQPDKPFALYGDGICYVRCATREEAEGEIAGYKAQDELAVMAAEEIDQAMARLCETTLASEAEVRRALRGALE